MTDSFPCWSSLHTIVFDFDGIFTDNKVWINQDGIESVRCDRGDGLGFDMLRSFIRIKNWHLDYFILSKEVNPVVAARAQKLSIRCVQATSDKAKFLTSYLIEKNKTSGGMLFVGNDLNDLSSIQMAGYSIAPCDAHPVILDQVDLVINKKGGEGFVRSVIERIIGIHSISAAEFLELDIL